jgi:hypothetical protein
LLWRRFAAKLDRGVGPEFRLKPFRSVSITMPRRGHRWRRARRPLLYFTAAVSAAALGLWIFNPGLASDFGVIPLVSPPELGRLHHFRGPKFWREGPPHLSNLQATAAKLLNQAKEGTADLWADGGPDLDKLQTAAKEIKERTEVVYGPIYYFFRPPVAEFFRNYVSDFPRRHRRCIDNDGDQDDRGCPKPKTHAVPEPSAWGMLIAGFALLGGELRRRRGSAAPA